MAETKRRNCLIKPQKPVVPKKIVDIIYGKRYYFCSRKNGLTSREIEELRTFKDVSLFRGVKTEHILSHLKYIDETEKKANREMRALPINLKTYSKAISTKRLFIEDPNDDIKTLRDIDPDFFGAIEGRPIRGYEDIKQYIQNIRDYCMNRNILGYRRDIILKLNKDEAEETAQYNESDAVVKAQIKNFRKFLKEDYLQSVAATEKAENLFKKIIEKNIEFMSYVNRAITVKNEILAWDSVRKTLKIYRRFMLFAAPLPWRQQYDESLADRIQSIQFETGTFEIIDDVEDLVEDIDKIVSEAQIEFKNILPAHMFFTDPRQMLHLFRSMEVQSGDYMLQLSISSVSQRMLQDKVKELNASIQYEYEYFQYFIDTINKNIMREEYNEKYLEDKFFRIMDDMFWESVASPSTLKLKLNIEYVYEQIFGACEEGHGSLREAMKVLEIFYEEYNLTIDGLDFNIVEEARKEMYEQDIIMMKNAHLAQRELREFESMRGAMKRAFMPPAKFQRPIQTKYMDKKILKELEKAEKVKAKLEDGEKIRPKPVKVAPEEQEALILFTEWCEGLDPGPFLKEYQTYVEPLLKQAFD